jgi:hypothetical protein
MKLNPKYYPLGDVVSWDMTNPSHEEYLAISHTFADQLISQPSTHSSIDIVEVAGQRIRDLASYCNSLKRECMRLDKRLSNVKDALHDYIDSNILHST